jgi:aromatic ring-opening dioxygenase LigB subunit
MPIVCAAVVPNLTLLIPSVGKETASLFTQTTQAYLSLAERLSNRKVETLVILSGRGLSASASLAINLGPKFDINFQEFGDFASKQSLACDLKLLQAIKQPLTDKTSLSLLSLNPLDYGSAVPALLLSAHQRAFKVLPFYPADISLNMQYQLGLSLAQILHSSHRNIALLASANFSHRLSQSPAGYLPKAKGYDKKIINAFESGDYKFLLNLSSADIKEYYEFGLSPLAMMAGAVNSFQKKVKVLSYEHHLGLACAVINFEF